MLPNRVNESSRPPPRDLLVDIAEQELTHTRAQVFRSVTALRHAIAKRTDWQDWVRRQPGFFLVAAFSIGFAYGQRAVRYRNARSR